MKGCKVFVTGGSGAVGRNLLPILADSGMELRALKHNTPIPYGKSEVVEGDIGNFQDSWLEDIDVVFHLAAKTIPSLGGGAMNDINVVGTERLVMAVRRAARPPRLIFTSSIAALGPSGNGLAVPGGSPPKPITDYGRSKEKAETTVREYDRGVIARLPMVIGPGDRLTRRFEKLARMRIFPVAPKRLSAIDVRDVARLLCHLAKAAGAEGQTYNVSDGEFYSWRDIARHFGGLRGRDVFTFTIPELLLQPWLFTLLGNSDGAYYLKHDWICQPNFPADFEIRHKVF